MDRGGSVYPEVTDDGDVNPGLTKRELFAAMAMQGMLAHGWCDGNDPYTVKAAVSIADLMLAELGK